MSIDRRAAIASTFCAEPLGARLPVVQPSTDNALHATRSQHQWAPALASVAHDDGARRR
ncbi:hypothetical protein [Xylanimonas sp. McL0601]|uniref:hypothetical protein n=1 Tax=Xylanimonas sp. McL0601 TaxID=3414739 RepID=UPI003CE6AFBB